MGNVIPKQITQYALINAMLDFSKNYFALFGLPEQFTVDIQLLTQNYLALQQQVHPDRHASGTAQVLRIALQEASLLNEAVRTLKDPITRAIYLLEQRGISIKTSTSSIGDEAFLLEQMALQEAIANVYGQPDPQQITTRIIEQITEYRKALLQTLATAFDTNNLPKAQDIIQKLQFLERTHRSATEAAVNLEDSRY